MSVAAGRPPQPAAPEHRPSDAECLRCGAELAGDQEWCLECGASRTLIHRPPDWRVPVAVIGVVVLLVLGGFLVALIGLSGNANRNAAAAIPTSAATPATPAATTASAAKSTTATTPNTSAARSTPVPTPRPATTGVPPSTTLATWPRGLPGWTVVLDASRSQSDAEAKASRIAAAGIRVGVLNSSEHPLLTPGYWIVFSGRYPTETAAQAQANSLIAKGQSGAHTRLVGTPGA